MDDRSRWPARPRILRGRPRPGGNPGANLESISHKYYLRQVAFRWELMKETIYLTLGCLQAGSTHKLSCGGLGQEKLIVRDILLAEISATGVDPGDRHESWITNPAKSSTKKTRTQFGMPAPNNLCSFQSDQGVNPCVRGLLVPRAQASLVTHFF